MNTKLIGFISATALAMAMTAAPAMATTLGSTNWNFFTLGGSPNSPGASLNKPAHTFYQGSLSLTTYAMTWSSATGWVGSPASLYIKNGGSTAEQGLGLNDDPYGYNEIAYPNGVELTGFSGSISSVTIGSLQSGENFQILGWSSSASQWVPLYSGMGIPVSQTYSGSNLMSYSNLIVWDPNPVAAVGGSNDILIESVTTVPEPGTLALLSFGLAAVGFAVSRRRKVKTEA